MKDGLLRTRTECFVIRDTDRLFYTKSAGADESLETANHRNFANHRLNSANFFEIEFIILHFFFIERIIISGENRKWNSKAWTFYFLWILRIIFL